MCKKCNSKKAVFRASNRFFSKFVSLPFIVLISIYRLFSPLKKFLLGPYAQCRFYPTCSEYSLECFRNLTVTEAITKTISRIAKCNPMHPGGYDPVFPEQDDSSKSSR
ncbi:MAG: membrane protein insertion efficiency factor YidD [Opitutae bacterium]|nr:membrane protein insertion efficiency factor YidD [Opitutae bacterium]